MCNQEQQDDEERKQSREEDICAGRIQVQPPRVQPITNHQIISAPIDEIDGLNWQFGWGSADRQSQVRVFLLKILSRIIKFGHPCKSWFRVFKGCSFNFCFF